MLAVKRVRKGRRLAQIEGVVEGVRRLPDELSIDQVIGSWPQGFATKDALPPSVLLQDLVVFRVVSDPYPNQALGAIFRDGAIVSSDANGPEHLHLLQS